MHVRHLDPWLLAYQQLAFLVARKNKSNYNNNNNNNWFLYSAFLVWDTTQSALQCITTPVTGFNINPALIVHLLNSLGSILARCYFRGARMPHHATNNVRILPGTHLYTWVESSNVDKVSCWRTKSARHWRESNPQPLIQSQGFNPIYHGTSTILKSNQASWPICVIEICIDCHSLWWAVSNVTQDSWGRGVTRAKVIADNVVVVVEVNTDDRARLDTSTTRCRTLKKNIKEKYFSWMWTYSEFGNMFHKYIRYT